MRYVTRDGVEAPISLVNDPNANENRGILVHFFSNTFEKLTQSTLELSDWVLKDAKMLRAVEDLFHGKCAFCETNLHPNISGVYRFRPKTEAAPVGDRTTSHLYYLWMADVWQNLYPICGFCHPERSEYFPVVSNKRVALPSVDKIKQFVERRDGRWPEYPLDEKPVFVDPCYDRMLWRHFDFRMNGEVLGRDRRGRETITHFALNRPDLINRRRAAFADAADATRGHLFSMNTPLSGEAVDFDAMQFGGAWRILLRNLLAEALDKRGGEDHEARLRKLADLPDGLQRFESAMVSFSTPPEPDQAGDDDSAPIARSPQVPSKIRINNFKSLEDITITIPSQRDTDAAQAGALMILGENAAGKSSILEGIAIALMGANRRRLLNLRTGDFILNPAYMGADKTARPKTAKVEMTGADGMIYALNLTLDPAEQRTVTRGFSETPYATPDLPLFAYGAFRKYLNAERRFSQDKHLRSLFHPEHVLSNPEKWLLRLNDGDFRMVVRALRHVFSFETEFEVLERDKKAKKVFVVTGADGQDDETKQRTPLEIVSSGFRSVLAMLCDIMQGLMDKRINPQFESLPTAFGLVLIDEIEAHLHPRWKMSIMTGLRTALPQVTFIATSHDPLCLRGMAQHEVLVLERSDGQMSDLNLPVFTQSIVDLPDNEYWTIEQLLTADFFRLRSTAAESEKRINEIERKLARGERDAEVDDFLQELSYTLPIGDTEVHRLVQDAVAEYLAERSTLALQKRQALKRDVKARIVDALRSAR